MNSAGGLATWLAAGGMASALSFGLPSTTFAQDTTASQQDTTRHTAVADSSSDSTKSGYNVERNPSEQNPQGYRGMERPAELSDSAQLDSAGRADADATNRVNQIERQDSIGNPDQNPPGYRGMERSVGSDTGMTSQKDSLAAKKSGTKKKQATMKKKSRQQAGQDTTRQDSTRWGYDVDRKPEVQNPPGYRGLERPVNVFPADSAKRDSGASADATSRAKQLGRQDSMPNREQQNPPGYRGMERPELDSTQQQGTSRDTSSRSRQDTSQVNRDRSVRQSADTSSTARVSQDTTADSARFGANAEEGSASSPDSLRDSVDIIHRQREVPPGIGHQPPPYPADSEQAWVRERPGGDSVSVELQQSRDSAEQNNRQ